MGVGKLDVWVSDVADACGTWTGSGRMTIFDCDGVLRWPCGKFRTEGRDWKSVPRSGYLNLPFRCGHLEAMVPPGCYWVLAGWVTPHAGHVHMNYTTHVGIAQVRCDEHACVKLFNPSVRLCWNWFRAGIRVLALRREVPTVTRQAVTRLEALVEKELLREVPRLPVDDVMEGIFKEMDRLAAKEAKKK